jgi:ribA/ribD-fused uncharacterized protein
MKYSVAWLKSQFDSDQRLKYVFFWGHHPRRDHQISKACFSQWYAAPFRLDGLIYRTAEHWMMAEKARLFHDSEILKQILGANSPAEAKKLGRRVHNFDPIVWDEVKYDIVVKGNLHKFSQHQDLKKFLLSTYQRILVEASPVDSIWGIGMAADEAGIENPYHWKGDNLLGFALMEVRDELSS